MTAMRGRVASAVWNNPSAPKRVAYIKSSLGTIRFFQDDIPRHGIYLVDEELL